MSLDLDVVKQLRETTGLGIVECQKALKQSDGNIEKAIEALRKSGEKLVATKQSRSTNQGIIEAYVHSNKKIAVLLELVCETDFVSRNEEFSELAHNLAMQVAALNPKWISPEEVPQEILEKEKEIYSADLPKDKPAEVIEKILNGKMQKFYSEFCLLKQPFIKDDKFAIEDLVKEKIAKFGENIKVKRFIRFAL
ncbi:MAG: translation elongation factor Ts [Patescibacteria group bacterium]|nr:translation elongation factor Ts [Patescibacteria group bacterium]MDD5164225.1 translation elongation factor Ts [Patescibacteria group bacterium]MDD5534643.1 translation elongation factor Ts [Patescibacteria group bacterium]